MYMLGPDILKLMPSAYTVAQELERYKMGVLKVSAVRVKAGKTVTFRCVWVPSPFQFRETFNTSQRALLVAPPNFGRW